jgi:hypothetical protein
MLPQISFLLFVLLVQNICAGQKMSRKDSINIFSDDEPINVTLATDLRLLSKSKGNGKFQNALFTCKLPDSTTVSEEILIQTRGHFRLENCALPSLRLNFRTPASPKLSFLKALKIVNACDVKANYEQLLLKEYLVYKMYNIITDMSFRARLLKINYQDLSGKKKPFTQYAFMLEDIDDMAKRNNCRELEIKNLPADKCHKEQMSIVDVFEFMIGNTDWSVIGNHNIKFITPRKDSTVVPYPIPYDFDFVGLVNAVYARPPEMLGIESVKDRLYRGCKRNIEEFQPAFKRYNEMKSKLYAVIINCKGLQSAHKKEMIAYLDSFYKIINNKTSAETFMAGRTVGF